MDYQGAVFAWAEDWLKLPSGSVVSVTIGSDDEGSGYSCCSYSSPGVWVTHSVPLTKRQRKPRTDDKFISLYGEDLASLIEGILWVAKEIELNT